MIGKFCFVFGLAASAVVAANAQAPAGGQWTNWEPTVTSGGVSIPDIQYSWRSVPPCTPGGCQLQLRIANTSHSPVKIHYTIYTDNPGPLHAGGAYRKPTPITGNALLKAWGGRLTGAGSAGDTTNPIYATAFNVTRVVIETDTQRPTGQVFTSRFGPPNGSWTCNDTIRLNQGTLAGNRQCSTSPSESSRFSITDVSADAPTITPVLCGSIYEVSVRCKTGGDCGTNSSAGGPANPVKGQFYCFETEAQASAFAQAVNNFR